MAPFYGLIVAVLHYGPFPPSDLPIDVLSLLILHLHSHHRGVFPREQLPRT